MDPALYAALSSGAVAVTPNRRLARNLHRSFAAAASRGQRVWATPSILPYGSWLETLWLDALASGSIRDPLRLLAPVQTVYAWQRIVAADARHGAGLIDARGAAKLAGEAWQLVHEWGAGGESWRGWPAAALGEDPASFVRWADAYAATLAAMHALDPAQLADTLAANPSGLVAWRDRTVLLVSFVELSPQQSRLLGALAAAGTRIERVDPLSEARSVARRASAATPRDEVASALAWARAQLDHDDAVVGIVVEDLSARRAEVQALAEEILSPALQWPGRESEPRPYNISLGEELGNLPLVASAIQLIALGVAPLPLERAAVLLRSPYLDRASAMWTRRAALEARWLDEGRREIGLKDAIAALSRVDAELAQRWEQASAVRLPASASPRDWTDRWRAWLHALGWPGDAPLSSGEYQARLAWDEMLLEFGSLAAVETRLARDEALSLLRAIAIDTIFQPEGPDASIQILGLLEAQGLRFDALWVSGLSAERWPPAPAPNALLPIFWQRERDLPRSSAARELAYARALTERYLRAAPRVVLSHPAERDEYACAPSALIGDLPELAASERPAPVAAAELIHAAAPALESVDDAAAPPLDGRRVPGGAGLFEKQSECPFRAVSIHRLDADCWPEVAAGLSAIERGVLLHRVLATFWRDAHDQATLLGLPPAALAARVDAAVAEAMASGAISPTRRRALPPLVLALEAERLWSLAREWLEQIERLRPAFAVLHTELDLSMLLGAIPLRLRIDRVDRMANGAIAVIDYKTGRAVPPAKWFDPRPQAPQLALYALAWHEGSPLLPVRAVAYGQVKRGELKLQGLVDDATAWPGFATPQAVLGSGAGWKDVDSHWRESLGALALEIERGHAAVAPRDAETCRRCGLQAFCRIGALANEERLAADDDG